MNQPNRLQVAGYSLFEMLVSLALVALMMLLLVTAEMQAIALWRELDEEEELAAEGRTFMQMISCDLRSASPSSLIKIGKTSEFFFLKRTPFDDLVAVGYFLDRNKQGSCYRFFAKPDETLKAQSQGKLAELEARAVAKQIHSELITTHLLSWVITPVWNSEHEMILLEINLALGKRTSHYFLSTVVALPSSQ